MLEQAPKKNSNAWIAIDHGLADDLTASGHLTDGERTHFVESIKGAARGTILHGLDHVRGGRSAWMTYTASTRHCRLGALRVHGTGVRHMLRRRRIADRCSSWRQGAREATDRTHYGRARRARRDERVRWDGLASGFRREAEAVAIAVAHTGHRTPCTVGTPHVPSR